MWTNYFITSFRSLTKRKGFTILNITGLALGITCCLLLFQYVSYEKSYDSFFSDETPIIRLNMNTFEQGKKTQQTATTYPFIAERIENEFPEVESSCRLMEMDSEPSNEEKQITISGVKGAYFADTTATKIFPIRIVKGTDRLMKDPMHILISEKLANKLFGNTDPIGKIISFKSEWDTWKVTVDGVFENFDDHSHLPVEALTSFSSINYIGKTNSGDTNSIATMSNWDLFYTYLQLKKGTDLKKFSAKLNSFCEKNINTLSMLKSGNRKVAFVPVPVKDVHLQSNGDHELKINGDAKRVLFMFLISLFILGIAWVNYINLATTQSVEKAKEVGIRKVAGASRFNLVFQFLTESVLINLIALAVGILLAKLLTPAFNQWTGLGASSQFMISRKYWLMFASIFIFGTLLSGLYPAFVLSSFQPVKVLKGAFKNSSSGLLLRRTLIILQFAIANILIAGTLVVYLQVKFMRSQPIGFNMNQVLILEGPRSIINEGYEKVFEPFQNEILQQPGIKNFTVSTYPMGTEIGWSDQVKLKGEENPITLFHMAIDYNFIPTYDMKVVAGRNFSKEFGLEQQNVLLNETAVKSYGFRSPKDAINKVLDHAFGPKTIIGVVADYHHRGLDKPIQPQLFYLDPKERRFFSIKAATSNMPAAIATIKKAWSKYFPSAPFNYSFLDEHYNQQYKASNQFGNIFALFSMIAIVIACIGLFGLTAFTITQRTKEIGIRKVLGASVSKIVMILSADFIKLLVMAFLLSVPVAWLVMHSWLKDYAYRITIGWWIFLAAGAVAVIIAISTISVKSVKAAKMNPIKSLRAE
jgi:putative ABC transport system permease protein